MPKKLTQKEFIERARKVHGNKYDYSKVIYKNSSTKVCIVCPKHGEFWQIPNSHLQGIGCPKCGDLKKGEYKKSNTDNFINRAKEVHGNKYDYSKSVYKGVHDKICIICPEHGEFWQEANNHLHGKGCPKCKYEKIADDRKYTTEQFILKAREVHGWKYDYSKVDYKDSHTKVCIICPIHGEFWQKPDNHLNGWGCKKCGDKSASDKKRKTKEEFIKKAREIHGDKYDYSKVDYKNDRTKICIICPEHGEFWQTPNNHYKYGCDKCGDKTISEKQTLTTEEFIEKARKVHGDKYDYSKVEYINNKKPVCIICPKHGEFWQTPNNHLRGNGCPTCNESKLENEMREFLKENGINYESQKSFKWLKYKNKLKLDFYLPEYNIAIECQGKQHYESKDCFGGEEEYIEIVERDLVKHNKCIENGISIIYYTNLKEGIVNKFLNETVFNKNDVLKLIKNLG